MSKSNNSRRAGIIAGLIVMIWSGRGWAAPPDSQPDVEPSATRMVVYLRPATPTATVPRDSLLVRELVRQAVLIAARDGLGLPTRDGALREPWTASGGNAADSANAVILTLEVKRTANQVLHARLNERSPGPKRVLWEEDFRLAQRDAYYKLPELLTVQAEAASRGELVEALKRAGLKAQSIAPDPAAAVPDGVEAELSSLSVFPQFAALRQLHGAIRTHGESSPLLGALARAYANMGLITQMQWNAAHQVFAARALLYAQRMIATAADHNSPLPLWHRAYAYTLAGLMAPAMNDLKKAEKLQKANETATTAPPWVALLDETCQYNTSALLDAAASAQPAPGQADITGLASYLGFLSVLDDSNLTTTVRIAHLAMLANPSCVQLLDDICRVGGVALNHEITVSEPEVFTTAIQQELPRVQNVPAEVIQAVQMVKAQKGSPSSRAALAHALLAAGNGDRAEPSWGTLGRLVQDTFFAQTQRRAYFMAFQWGVGDEEVSQYATYAAQLIGDHPYYPLIKAYGMANQSKRALDELNRHLKLVDADASMVPLQEEFGQEMKFGPDHVSLWYRIMSHRDDTVWDISRLMALYSDPTSETRIKLGILLHAVSPESPSAKATMILGAWDRVGDATAKQWEEETGNHPMVLAALAKHDQKLGRLTEAADLWQKVVAVAPDPFGYESLAYVYLKQGNEARWLATMKKVFTLEDNSLSHADAQNRIARHYMLQHRYSEGWPWAEQAAQSWAAWAMQTATDCAEGLQDWKDAELWAQRDTERYPQDISWYMWCRRTGHGNVSAASQAIQPALSLMKRRLGMEDLAVLGTYYLLERQPDSALMYLRKRQERLLGPMSSLHVAALLDEHGDAAGRDAVLQKALKDTKDNTPAEKAETAKLLKVIKLINTGYPDGQFDLAAIDQAIAALPEQSRIDDNYFVGRILIDKKQTAKGIEYLKRCIEAPPFSYSLARVLAYDLLRRQGIDPMPLEHELALKKIPPATTRPAG